MRQKRIDELQDQIDNLKDEFNELSRDFEDLKYNFGSMVDEHIKNRIYYQTVENLENYRKGRELKKPINAIKEILR